MFKATLQDDLRAALKGGDGVRATTLRFLIAELHKREIEKRSTGQAPILTDEEAIAVLQREVKKRKEAIELFRKGGREDLVVREQNELLMIEKYLPPPIDESEIQAIVRALKGSGLHDFNSLMREAMKKLKGKADGNIVASAVKKELNE